MVLCATYFYVNKAVERELKVFFGLFQAGGRDMLKRSWRGFSEQIKLVVCIIVL